MKGRTIVFSGLDGAGKSTQIDLLIDKLQAHGLETVYLWSRGGYTPLFSGLKALIRRLSGKQVMPPSGPSKERTNSFDKPWTRRIWLTIAILDLILVYAVQIRCWIFQGKMVICDRYYWDTLIDFRLNFPQEQFEDWFIWRVLTRLARRPYTVFLLLIPVDESLKRSQVKGEPFPDTVVVLERRLLEYEKLAQGGEWLILDGRRPIDELAALIAETLALFPAAEASSS